MRCVAFAPRFDTPGINPATGKPWRDATTVFQPEARRFLRSRGASELHLFNNLEGRQRRSKWVLDRLEGEPIDELAFFCHGYTSGIQAGLLVGDFAEAAKRVLTNEDSHPNSGVVPVIYLYACSTGGARRRAPGGEGGYADLLRDAICNPSGFAITILAHSTLGHATKNPYLRVFSGPNPGQGGQYVVEPATEHWDSWKLYLQGPGRFRPLSFSR